VFKFLASSHTICPLQNGCTLRLNLSAMRTRVSSCAAKASCHARDNELRCSSTEGNVVDSNVRGMAIGEMPYMSSNGVLVQSACWQLL